MKIIFMQWQHLPMHHEVLLEVKIKVFLQQLARRYAFFVVLPIHTRNKCLAEMPETFNIYKAQFCQYMCTYVCTYKCMYVQYIQMCVRRYVHTKVRLSFFKTTELTDVKLGTIDHHFRLSVTKGS